MCRTMQCCSQRNWSQAGFALKAQERKIFLQGSLPGCSGVGSVLAWTQRLLNSQLHLLQQLLPGAACSAASSAVMQ